MSKRSEVMEGVVRLYGRTRSILDPETGDVVASVPSPDLLLVTHSEGVSVYRSMRGGPPVLLADPDYIKAAVLECASAEVRKRTAAATDIANGRTPK